MNAAGLEGFGYARVFPYPSCHGTESAILLKLPHSPVTIQCGMGPPILIMPMFSKAHWLLREAKAAAWVNLSLDPLHSARESCSPEGVITNIFNSSPPISEAWDFLFAQAKAYLIRNDWWWENLSLFWERQHFLLIYFNLFYKKTFLNQIFQLSRNEKKRTCSFFKTANGHLLCSLSHCPYILSSLNIQFHFFACIWVENWSSRHYCLKRSVGHSHMVPPSCQVLNVKPHSG